jgi:hypothetical protein
MFGLLTHECVLQFSNSLLSSGTLNFTEFVNMFTDYGKITSSSPSRKEQVNI